MRSEISWLFTVSTRRALTDRGAAADRPVVTPNVRGEAGPTAMRQARRKDDTHNLEGGLGALPLGLASTEGLGRRLARFHSRRTS